MQNPIINYTSAEISFPSFESYKEICKEIAINVHSMEVTESSVKEVKHNLADTRRFIKLLDDRRKEVKKQVLEPYTVLEKQVKELVEILDEADREVRSRVKELEEKERDRKKIALIEIWHKRANHYDFVQYIPDAFQMWLTPQHLNKTKSIKSCEADMVDFLEKTQREVDVIMRLDDAVEILTAYSSTLNMADSIEVVRARNEIRNKIESVDIEEEDFDDVEPIESACFYVEGKAEIALVERLFTENGIKIRRI